MQLTLLWARDAFELGLGEGNTSEERFRSLKIPRFSIVKIVSSKFRRFSAGSRGGGRSFRAPKRRIRNSLRNLFEIFLASPSRENGEIVGFSSFSPFSRRTSWWNQRAPIALIYDCLHQRGIGVCHKTTIGSTTTSIQWIMHFAGWFRLSFFSLSITINKKKHNKRPHNFRFATPRNRSSYIRFTKEEEGNFIYISFYITLF